MFTQMIDFQTARIDEFLAGLDATIASMKGHSVPHRAVVAKDCDRDNHYLLMVEFASHELAVENSHRPDVGQFSAFLSGLCDQPPAFRNLEVLRDEDV
jgi:hypothetical protein